MADSRHLLCQQLSAALQWPRLVALATSHSLAQTAESRLVMFGVVWLVLSVHTALIGHHASPMRGIAHTVGTRSACANSLVVLFFFSSCFVVAAFGPVLHCLDWITN